MAELILEPYAVSQRWRLPDADGRWEGFLAEYLETLARRCAEKQPYIIGHIKALALFLHNGYAQASVVGSDLPAQVKGNVPPGCTELTLSLNVIVYGLEYDLIERLTCETAIHLAERWKGEVKIEATDSGPQPPTGRHLHPSHFHPEDKHE
ncbi:MAG: hypothetical protein M1281_10440 [Chloroflexi bacterium]|nr:hypothetical protein [Chloroflexota bacterium]